MAKTNKLEVSPIAITYLEALQIFNFSAAVRANKQASEPDKLAATRNYLNLLSINKEHSSIIETIQKEFKAAHEEAISALQEETDKDKQKHDEEVLMKLQQKWFEEEPLLVEFCAKSTNVLLYAFSLALISDEANCPSYLLSLLSEKSLILL